MASVSHLAAGALCGAVYSRRTRTNPMVVVPAFAALGLAPDLDFIALQLGSEGTPLDHRVLTHSLVFALVVGSALGLTLGRRHGTKLACLLSVAALVSHGLLDALTEHGPGPQLLWPFSRMPIQFAWHPIPGTHTYLDYFTTSGLRVMLAEGIAWVPLLLLTVLVLSWPRVGASARASASGGRAWGQPTPSND